MNKMQEILPVRADMEQMIKQDEAMDEHNRKPHQSVKTACILFFLPKGGSKRFEKKRSRMVYHAILGIGVRPNKHLIFEDDIKNHCLPRSERSDNLERVDFINVPPRVLKRKARARKPDLVLLVYE
jgi:hypothetical protein